MQNLTLFVGNTNVLELKGLMSSTTSTYQNSGMGVTATLYTLTGSEVAGQTWPAGLSYVSASSGDYRATLSHSLDVAIETSYRAVITAVASATGVTGKWVRWITARDRTT